MDQFFRPWDEVDQDDGTWYPWKTELHSQHALSGTLESSGQPIVLTALLVSYARTQEEAKITGHVIFEYLISTNGFELA
jgi:hypothetical protein